MLLTIVERVKHMFDVAADPGVIAEHLAVDPLLKSAWSTHAGIRVPGAWDPFELAVRAILGQQISVRAATTIAGRVAATWGSPVEAGNGLDRIFPHPRNCATRRSSKRASSHHGRGRFARSPAPCTTARCYSTGRRVSTR